MDTETAGRSYSIDESGLANGERVGPMFQPDALLSSEFFADRSANTLEPEERLVLAILADAIKCFQDNHMARQGRRKRIFDEVREWIFDGRRDWVFGFENICSVLGFDPAYVRDGLGRWRMRELSRGGNPRIRAIHEPVVMRKAS
jgi:hypothetical protein